MTRNTNLHYEFSFANGTTVTRQCRNSLGSYAKMAQAIKAEFGPWASVQEVWSF